MNHLTVNLQQSILTLHDRGWSARRIARELGIHRETVGAHLKRAKPAIVTAGSGAADPAKPAKLTTGSRSLCQPHGEVIEAALLQGLSAQRIFQDLQTDHGYTGGYQSVQRFVRALAAATPLPFRRMETSPGEEMQVDFGLGAPVVECGKKRRPHLFRATLSFSRKSYSEAVWRQDTESFLRCLENAFRRFGGVTKTTIPDNLKAAVLRADWFDPELNPKLASFARHYGTVILPTKPRTPQHKGKVEAGVKFVQNNALKGRTFTSLGEQNLFLDQWELNVADKRIHGTVRQQVQALFEAQERPALQPLPAGLFPCFHEAQRRVHRDGHVEYNKAYYSVPPECVGREVWIRAEAKLLHIYTLQMLQIAVDTLVTPGCFATDAAHIHPHKRNAVERGAAYLLERCQLIGPHTGAWAEAMCVHRGPLGTRVLQGLLQLTRKHPSAQLESASQKASRHGSYRLRDLRRLIAHGETVVPVDFLQEHALIRDLNAYKIETFKTFTQP